VTAAFAQTPKTGKYGLQTTCSRSPAIDISGHQSTCQPVTEPPYRPGDYVKVEFPDETTGIGEWMVSRHHVNVRQAEQLRSTDDAPTSPQVLSLAGKGQSP